MQISIHIPDDKTRSAYVEYLSQTPDVSITPDPIYSDDGKSHYLTPGNSYGFMDGGFDLVMARIFPGIEAQVRRWAPIAVGHAFRSDRVIYAPTMIYPMMLPPYSINAYLALMAALRQGDSPYNPIKHLRMPALGTGVGAMEPEDSAFQVLAAIQDYRDPPELDSHAAVTVHLQRIARLPNPHQNPAKPGTNYRDDL